MYIYRIYKIPDVALSLQRAQPESVQFGRPDGVPLYPVLTTTLSLV